MTKRQKQEVLPTLKADDYKGKKDGEVIETGFLRGIKDIQTVYGVKTVFTIEINDTENEQIQVFANAQTLNQLIEDCGDEDNSWLGQPIKITKETDEKFKKTFLKVSKNIEKVPAKK